ncbi:MAG: SMC-Scp complex subunit ScpB [Actinomycetota bacterium]|nr:SMC-Scp complex subunit ScpB [Actinomycetota bacterium]
MSSEIDTGATGLTNYPAAGGPVDGALPVGDLPADDAPEEATDADDAADAAEADDEADTAEAASRAQATVSDDELVGALEAVLLVVDSPVTEQALATAVGRSVDEVRTELISLTRRYAEARSGIDLREIGGGWRFYTRDRFALVVERFVLDGQQSRLSRAALESLAVIAYRQPVTRARIAGVRGVNVDGVIRTLVARGLIEEIGTDAETGGLLYRTTEQFLERLGLNSLEELPEIGPLLPEVDAIDDV